MEGEEIPIFGSLSFLQLKTGSFGLRKKKMLKKVSFRKKLIYHGVEELLFLFLLNNDYFLKFIASVRITDIRYIQRGQETDIFKRKPKPELVHLSFSILYAKPGESEPQIHIKIDLLSIAYWKAGLMKFMF